MDYTISIGSNEQRRENMELARRRLTELFSGIRFSEEEETVPLFFHRPNLFSNQVACFASDNPVEEVTACLKAIVRLDIDLLSCDGTVYKPKDLKRDYILRGLKQLL